MGLSGPIIENRSWKPLTLLDMASANLSRTFKLAVHDRSNALAAPPD